jgi:Arc/MetJ-type ribon-helix-helix transcriptional regulator
MARIDVTLSQELKAFVESEASRGGYNGASQYVEALLEELWRHTTLERLEAELVRRIDGPAPHELPDNFWEDMKARLRQRHPTGGRA